MSNSCLIASNNCLIASNTCHIASDSNLVACKKSVAEQFKKFAGNDCLKTHTNFDETFAESFSDIVVKTQ